MKAKFFAATMSSLMASSALAQGSVPVNGNKTDAPGSSTATTLSTARGGTSTASIADTTPKGLKRFTLTLMNETRFTSEAGIAAGGDENGGLNRIQLSYDLTSTKKLTFREDTTFKTPKNQDTEYHINDPFVAYTDSKFATLPGNWIMTIQPRLYLPLGEKSRFEYKSVGAEALTVLLDKSVGRFDFEFMFLGIYHNNTQDYYYTKFNPEKRDWEASGVPDWQTFYMGEVAYNITDKLSLVHDLTVWTKALRATPYASSSSTTLLLNETMLGYQITKQLKVIGAIENDVAFNNENSVDLYQGPDMLYNLYVKLTL